MRNCTEESQHLEGREPPCSLQIGKQQCLQWIPRAGLRLWGLKCLFRGVVLSLEAELLPVSEMAISPYVRVGENRQAGEAEDPDKWNGSQLRISKCKC